MPYMYVCVKQWVVREGGGKDHPGHVRGCVRAHARVQTAGWVHMSVCV